MNSIMPIFSISYFISLSHRLKFLLLETWLKICFVSLFLSILIMRSKNSTLLLLIISTILLQSSFLYRSLFPLRLNSHFSAFKGPSIFFGIFLSFYLYFVHFYDNLIKLLIFHYHSVWTRFRIIF